MLLFVLMWSLHVLYLGRQRGKLGSRFGWGREPVVVFNGKYLSEMLPRGSLGPHPSTRLVSMEIEGTEASHEIGIDSTSGVSSLHSAPPPGGLIQ